MKNCFIMRFPFEIQNILFLGVVRSTSILYSIPLLELIFMKQTMYYISAFLIAVLLPRLHNGQYNNGGCFTDYALLYNRTSCIYLLVYLLNKHVY